MPKVNDVTVSVKVENGIGARNIKIKQEKITPPPSPSASEPRKDLTEQLFNKLLGETKPVAEPVKSSNEILADLFKVFNAAPPKLKEAEGDDDGSVEDEPNSATSIHKHKKKHKKEKKSKKSKHKKRGRSSSDVSESNDELQSKETSKSPSKSHKVKREKKREKRMADDGDENDKKSKRHKKSKDHDKSPTHDLVKTEQCDDEHKTTDSEERKSNEKSTEAAKRVTSTKALDRLNDKLKERRKSAERRMATTTESVNSDPDSIAGRKKIVIKSLINCKVFRDKLREVEAKEKEKRRERESDKDRSKEKGKKSNGESSHDRRHRSESSSSSLSLSDEETYLKERESRYSSGANKYIDRDRDVDDFYGDSRRRDRTRERDLRDRNERHEPKEKSFRSSHYRYEHDRRRSRSRDRRENSDDRIDKKRLLEIARKNAITMLKNGTLPGTQNLGADAKEKALAKMRFGGKSVDELTEFCKRLSKGESSGYLSNVSNESEDEADIDKAFHHPFVLKDRGPIVMNIRNSIPIPPKTSEQTKAILMQFPVSSGQHHRLNESEWVPVSPTKPPKKDKEQPQQPLAIMPAPPAVPEVSRVVTPQSVPAVTVTPYVPPVQPVPPAQAAANAAVSIPLPQPVAAPPQPTITNETYLQQQHQQQTYQYPPPTPVTEEPAPSANIFSEASTNKDLDVTSIITKRLNAMRKLQDNPLDTEALKLMYNTQKDMSAWASSKFVPGQFTGSTGANVLSAKELSSGFQAWAKRDQLISTTPVSGGMGMHLLQKMGWRPGEGLGKEKNGSLQPLLLEVKLDKRGLVADEETPQSQRAKAQAAKKKQQASSTIQMAKQTMENKHPVSLLGELCAKRKYGAPFYEVVMEDGPFHHRKFLFKVTMNGQVFQPTIPSLNKKEAKAVAARFALEQMGLLSGPPTTQ